PDVLARAFAVFHSARPRPVHIEIPIDVISASADHVTRKVGAVPAGPAPCLEAIEQATAALNASRAPLVLLGGGAVNAYEDIQTPVGTLDAPAAVTVNAKGLLRKRPTLLLGSLQSIPSVRAVIRSADVVLAIGTELGETDYDTFAFDGNFLIDGTLIRVDIDP